MERSVGWSGCPVLPDGWVRDICELGAPPSGSYLLLAWEVLGPGLENTAGGRGGVVTPSLGPWQLQGFAETSLPQFPETRGTPGSPTPALGALQRQVLPPRETDQGGRRP